MKASSETLIDLPVERIDLVEWIENLSDREYQACSGNHLGAGGFHEGRTFGTINVETVGGHLLIQHYLAERAERHHVVMRSRQTRVHLMHLLPATIEVIWTLEVEPKDGGHALFRCTVETNMNPVLAAAARLAVLPVFLRLHVREETPLFARDIARKIAAAGQSGFG